MGGETAFARMARPGVVDGDERRAGKPRPQHSLVLGAEAIQLRGQQPHHLTFGDRQAQAGQKRHDPFAGHLALKMQHQHKTIRCGPHPPTIPAASGAISVSPSGVSQRSRR